MADIASDRIDEPTADEARPSDPSPAPLAPLAPLLRDEPALARVLGRRAGVLAVPEHARAVTLAGLAHLSDKRPLVVATPTSTAALRLADDLSMFVEDVELFP